MSQYANYQALSKQYDVGRSAFASNLYVGAFLTKLNKPLKDVHLLDAGCGTGNYAKAMLEAGVGRVTLLDASVGMLEKAKDKMSEFIKDGSVVEVRQHCLPAALPFEDGIFDAVMINNVLHHLPDMPDSNGQYPNFRKVVEEVYRVLKPQGLFISQQSFPHQILKGHWLFHLAPKAMKEYSTIYVPNDECCKVFHEVGFHDYETVVPTSALLYTEAIYFNEDGPTDLAVRGSDSFWARVSDEEMAELTGFVKTRKANGTMKAFIAEKDKDRKEVGMFSLVFGSK